MPNDDHGPELTPSLEDYLETIYQLSKDRPVVRVRDIAKARHVRAASVSPAMGRLTELGFIAYQKREYIELTSAGLDRARRIFAKHQALTRFFRDLLQLEEVEAVENACAMEHSLTDAAMDKLVRLFEFLTICPRHADDFIRRFQQCPIVQHGQESCLIDGDLACDARDGLAVLGEPLSKLEAGDSATVTHISATGGLRQGILGLGFLPETQVTLIRREPDSCLIHMPLQGVEVNLRMAEARAIIVARVSTG